MPEKVQVKTELTVDAGSAASTLGGLRKQFDLTNDARRATQEGMGFFKQSLSVMAGTYIPQLIHKARELGESFLNNAAEEKAQQRAMSGLISSMQGIPWDEAAEQSSELADHLDQIALRTSQVPDDIKSAFQLMEELGGATEENIQKSLGEVEKFAQISRVLGMSTSAIAQEYEFMGEGILRTRGKMFQLLQTTGIFGDKTKQAAGMWAKLSSEKREELLAFGLDKLATKMEKAPEGFGSLTNQMKAMREMAEESLGMPLLEALTPHLKSLVMWMKNGRGEIDAFAQKMASDVHKYADEAGRVLREGWDYVRSNWDNIKNGVITAWSYAEKVIRFAVEHKEAIAMAYGAKMVLGSAPAQAAIGAGKAVYNLGAGAMTAGGTAAGVAGGVVALGAFSAAIVGVGLAAWQASKLMQDIDDNEKADVRARYEYFRDMADKSKNEFAAWDEVATQHFEYTRKKFMDESNLLGMSRGEAEQMANVMRDQHEANRKMVEFAEDAAKRYQALYASQQGMVDVSEQNSMISVISRQFQAAQEANNQGAMQYIANLLTRSQELRQAFLQSADMTSEGYKWLADLTQQSAGEFSDSLKRLAEEAAKKEKKTASAPIVNFNGGQTFKIQQDFRDQDPDKVFYVMQRDVLAAATRRLQSSYATPFGT